MNIVEDIRINMPIEYNIIRQYNLKELKDELSKLNDKIQLIMQNKEKLTKEYEVCLHRKVRVEAHLNKIIATKDVFASVSHLEGFKKISPEELIVISSGMIKKDIELLVTKVIKVKTDYPNWTLMRLCLSDKYQFTYDTPHGIMKTCI